MRASIRTHNSIDLFETFQTKVSFFMDIRVFSNFCWYRICVYIFFLNTQFVHSHYFLRDFPSSTTNLLENQHDQHNKLIIIIINDKNLIHKQLSFRGQFPRHAFVNICDWKYCHPNYWSYRPYNVCQLFDIINNNTFISNCYRNIFDMILSRLYVNYATAVSRPAVLY